MTSGVEVIVAYFDSSALVKVLLSEPETEQARTLWDTAGMCVTSWLTSAEVAAALGAARRSRRLSAGGLRRALEYWTARQAEMAHVQVGGPVARRAADLAVLHALRGADALQLASALLIGGDLVFVCFDGRLRHAAAAEGLILAPAVAGGA